MAPRIIYLTPEQLCERWNHAVTKKTLQNWRSLRKGPSYRRFGHRILYPLPDVEAFEREREIRLD